jgi:hypothetical protein
MAYPPFEEYQDALRGPARQAFTDPTLASGQVVRQRNGEPLARSGNFALTYEVIAAGKRHAVRCFHKFCDALPQRYDAIARRLAETASPYFVDCEFQAGGIRTESGWYPIVRMDWVEGDTLGAFVADHHDDAVTLQQLRASLRVLARQLAGLGIAHGDIQPGNIIVRGATDLTLIDYDGMYVPELAPLGSAELGQRNFQHPGRRWRHYHARLDAFSFAVIDVALGALAYRPQLWDIARCDESAFIFRAEDFLEPWTSSAFAWAREIPGLETKSQQLAAICQSPFDAAPGIEDFLAGRNIPTPSVRVSSQPFRGRTRYLPAFAVIDAANFAQACAHVGDRVELVGRVQRARTSSLSLADGGSIRVEFGRFPDDMASLDVRVAADSTDEVLDLAREGDWLSAIGLVDPPHVERIENHACKLVTLQIEHRSQLTRLSAAEARHRLAASVRAPSGDDAETGKIGTDPAFPDPAEQATAVDAAAAVAPAPEHEPRAGAVPATDETSPGDWLPAAATIRLRSRAWITGSVLAVAMLLAIWAGRSWREAALDAEPATGASRATGVAAEPPVDPEATGTTDSAPPAQAFGPAPGSTGARGPATTPVVTAQEARLPSLRSARNLGPRDLPLATSLGRVAVARRNQLQLLVVDGREVDTIGAPLLKPLHLADFSERVVLTGVATCAPAVVDCRESAPFWLVLRRGATPRLIRSSATAAGSTAPEVTALASGIHVDLGLWNGMHRWAMLTARDDPFVVALPGPRTRLDRTQCSEVLRALESCAAVRGCGSFARIANALPPARAASVRRLFHATTGLNASQFRSVCVRSCELGLTPTRPFVQQRVCSGAERGQWDSELL